MSNSISSKPSFLQRATDFIKANEETIKEKAPEFLKAGGELKEQVKDGFEAAKKIGEKGFKVGSEEFKADKLKELTNPTGKLNLLGKLTTAGGVVGGAVGVVTGLAKLPKQIKEIGEAAEKVRSSSGEERSHAVNELTHKAGEALKGAIETTTGALKAGVTGSKLLSTYKAAGEAFSKVAPNALPAVKRAAQFESMKQVFEGTSKAKDVLRAVSKEALSTAKTAGAALGEAKGLAAAAGTASRAAGKATLEAAGKAAGEAAIHAGAEVATKGFAKAAARFAPGANIAMAAIDTAVAVSTIRDPKASNGAKITAGITALGSIAAATNIPVVSQIGAGVSIVSSLVGGFFK
jgi:hypothetical protein